MADVNPLHAINKLYHAVTADSAPGAPKNFAQMMVQKGADKKSAKATSDNITSYLSGQLQGPVSPAFLTQAQSKTPTAGMSPDQIKAMPQDRLSQYTPIDDAAYTAMLQQTGSTPADLAAKGILTKSIYDAIKGDTTGKLADIYLNSPSLKAPDTTKSMNPLNMQMLLQGVLGPMLQQQGDQYKGIQSQLLGDERNLLKTTNPKYRDMYQMFIDQQAQSNNDSYLNSLSAIPGAVAGVNLQTEQQKILAALQKAIAQGTSTTGLPTLP